MTKLTKGDFLSVLSSKSPQEIEDEDIVSTSTET